MIANKQRKIGPRHNENGSKQPKIVSRPKKTGHRLL
jgi:hypothetical protein